MKVTGLILIISVICFGNSFSLELSLNTADTAPYSTIENDGFYDILLKEVFNSLDIDIKINHLPSKRSIQNANNGVDDGEYARIEGISNEYNNLIIVPEPLVNFYFAVFTTDPDIIISDWQDLSGYNIAFINGWKIFENNVPDDSTATRVKDADSLFRMLLSKRVDIILYSRERGLKKIAGDNLNDIFILDPPIAVRGMYLYMNSRHEELISNIADSLKEVKESGRYSEILNKYLGIQ